MHKRQDPRPGSRRWRLTATAGVAALVLSSLPSVADTQPVLPSGDVTAPGDTRSVLLHDRVAGAASGLSFSFAISDRTAADGAAERPDDAQTVFAEPPIDKSSERVLRIGTADELIAMFEAIGFSYVDVRDAGLAVPRLQVAAFPRDIGDLDTLFLRKSAFFNTLLPIVLQVNESILQDRRRLLAARARLRDGEPLTPADYHWLSDLADRYRIADRDLDDLVVRVDVVPPSMALAMAAVESGWGTSRLARQGNALFGQITTSGTGMAASSGHTYARFATLRDSVAAYAMNLNTHAAYRDFRAMRTDMRRNDETLSGYQLMGTLLHYSELRDRYIAYVRRVMRDDDMSLFDDARLAPISGLGRPS